ncbi:hypothetical protein J2D73_10900 [Acetobacter sacchari]|uniref:Uncharacterized protein n=1 Tax=Acetobacter sacchari TaxID=2661687 RepID=A0ABS3LWM7_9PROT|nr:hypothetical protein [Acetobacter sacchari]MBO1360295.1 hypothetical protein [Acetobacter sacchari]
MDLEVGFLRRIGASDRQGREAHGQIVADAVFGCVPSTIDDEGETACPAAPGR